MLELKREGIYWEIRGMGKDREWVNLLERIIF